MRDYFRTNKLKQNNNKNNKKLIKGGAQWFESGYQINYMEEV